MSRFVGRLEDGKIIRGTGKVKVAKSTEETQESNEVEPEAQGESR
jgi:hypothetical protein